MTQPTPHGFHLVTGAPAALEDAFLDQVAGIRAADPLAPVDVLVGSILLRPYLQQLIAETSPGMINVRFQTVGDLSVFAEAGIPVYMDQGPSLAERPLGPGSWRSST